MFVGNGESSINYVDNTYFYRQDSTFLYYFGLSKPGLIGWIDLDADKECIFGDDPTIDSIVWTGSQPAIRELAQLAGIGSAGSLSDFRKMIHNTDPSHVRYLPPYRGEHVLQLSEYLGYHPSEVARRSSASLIMAVANQRNIKSDEEIDEIDKAVSVTADMHLAAMHFACEGMTEATVTAKVHEVAIAARGNLSFPIIGSINGQFLHKGFNEMASNLEVEMKKRADHWNSLEYPFGSEMPWDSTGQEEVYMWTSYFGYADKADVTLNAVLAYMPTVPYWGYNGSARRYWDFVYGGKLARIERQLHHYGSGLNAILVLAAYRDNPDDFYLLRVGHAGSMGPLANITRDGFGPAAFHSYPSTLDIDGYAGDYGSGFYGYAVNSSSYIYHHPEFGWVAFSGNLTQEGDWIKTEITTAGKNSVFIAPESLEINAVSGKIRQVDYNPLTDEMVIEFSGDAQFELHLPEDKKILSEKSLQKNKRGYYEIKKGKKERSIFRFKLSNNKIKQQ